MSFAMIVLESVVSQKTVFSLECAFFYLMYCIIYRQKFGVFIIVESVEKTYARIRIISVNSSIFVDKFNTKEKEATDKITKSVSCLSMTSFLYCIFLYLMVVVFFRLF